MGYTLVFKEAAGNVPQMVCGMNSVLQGVSASAACTHRTVTEGNYIGGYFILGNSAVLSADISATDMETQLELLFGVGDIHVTRSGPDYQGGYTWLITWLSAVGDQGLLTSSNSLTGSGTNVVVSPVTDGNYLGGSFRLSYKGVVTDLLPYNADAFQVKTALERMSDVGKVDVSESSVSTEGGKTYTITFKGISGDAYTLGTVATQLTGTGATVKAMERIKGSKASGTTLKVSFQSPQHCSESQVPYGECGAPIDKYTINAGASASSKTFTKDYLPNYDVQLIRIAAPSLVSTTYFENNAVSGYFKLSYGSSVTSSINAGASAADMRDAVESLTGINTVSVTRSYSASIMTGTVQITTGGQTLSCTDQNCDFQTLIPGELIRVGGIWFKVRDTYDGVNQQSLPLGLVNDSSVIAAYTGSTNFEGQIFRWARGYEWTITFLSTDAPMQSLSSPAHGLNPLDASVSIRAEDCTDCIFIEGLTAWYNNFLDIQAHNRHGYGPTTSTQGIPKEIPGPPEGVNLKSASGTELFLFFNKPASAADVAGITHYTVEWDTSPLFNHANKNDTRSCTSSGHGLCVVNGAALDVEPPYEFTISQLNEFTTYYVRVAARNSLSQQVEVGEADSTNWSAIASTYPEDQPPSAPLSINGTTGGIGSAQLFITKPKSTGGKAIESYNIQVSTDSGFDTVSEVTVAADDIVVLDTQQAVEGPIVYDYTGLTIGSSYYVRVRAKNEKGYSLWTNAPNSVLIAGKPSAPSSVALSTATIQDAPISHVDVSWNVPASNGGSNIDEYFVEVWQEKRVAEEQLVRFIHPTENRFPNETQFSLKFSTTPSLQDFTETLPYNIEEYNLRSELMNIGYLNNSFPIGNIEVTRTAMKI